MYNGMIIIETHNDDSSKQHYVCPCRDCNGDMETIPEYYSHQHAFDKGWRFVMNIKYSEYGKVVAVCPSCWEKNEGLIVKVEV